MILAQGMEEAVLGDCRAAHTRCVQAVKMLVYRWTCVRIGFAVYTSVSERVHTIPWLIGTLIHHDLRQRRREKPRCKRHRVQ